jgi:hypothetical protein
MTYYITCQKRNIEKEAHTWAKARIVFTILTRQFPEDLIEWYGVDQKGKSCYITNQQAKEY